MELGGLEGEVQQRARGVRHIRERVEAVPPVGRRIGRVVSAVVLVGSVGEAERADGALGLRLRGEECGDEVGEACEFAERGPVRGRDDEVFVHLPHRLADAERLDGGEVAELADLERLGFDFEVLESRERRERRDDELEKGRLQCRD